MIQIGQRHFFEKSLLFADGMTENGGWNEVLSTRHDVNIYQRLSNSFIGPSFVVLICYNHVVVMKGGRARWRIENETFNTLKNQGYHFEHHFGHGDKHLSSVFANLMLLAFFIDQLVGLSCNVFQPALQKMKIPLYFLERFRSIFFNFRIPNWMTFYQTIISRPKFDLPIIDTS